MANRLGDNFSRKANESTRSIHHAPKSASTSRHTSFRGVGGFLAGGQDLAGSTNSTASHTSSRRATPMVHLIGDDSDPMAKTVGSDGTGLVVLPPTQHEQEAIEKTQAKLQFLQERLTREKGRVADYKETIRKQEVRQHDITTQLALDQVRYTQEIAAAKQKLGDCLAKVGELSVAVAKRRHIEGQLDQWLNEGVEKSRAQKAAMVQGFIPTVNLEKILDPQDVERFEMDRKMVRQKVRDDVLGFHDHEKKNPVPEWTGATIRSSYVAISNELCLGAPTDGDAFEDASSNEDSEDKKEGSHGAPLPKKVPTSNVLKHACDAGVHHFLLAHSDLSMSRTIIPDFRDDESSASVARSLRPQATASGLVGRKGTHLTVHRDEDAMSSSVVGALLNSQRQQQANGDGVDVSSPMGSMNNLTRYRQDNPHEAVEKMLVDHRTRYEGNLVGWCLEDQLCRLQEDPTFESIASEDVYMPHSCNT